MADEAGPRAFAELDKPQGRRCRRCGEVATHRMQLAVRMVDGGLGKVGGARPVIASHLSDLCEPCAVRIFDVTAKAMR